MPPDISNILYAILGFLLAVLGKGICDAVESRKKAGKLRDLLVSDLKDLKFRLASTSYAIVKHFRQCTEGYVRWINPLIVEYAKRYEPPEAVMALEESLNRDVQLIVMENNFKRPERSKAIALKKQPCLLLDLSVSDLSLLTAKQRLILIDIRAQIKLLEQEIELGQSYLAKTFDQKLDQITWEAVNNDLDNSYQFIDRVLRRIIDKIEKFERAC